MPPKGAICHFSNPRPECPHCRKAATDVAAAQHLAKIAEAFDAQVGPEVRVEGVSIRRLEWGLAIQQKLNGND